MRKELEAAIARRAGTYHDASDAIWEFAELGLTEDKSSQLLADLLEKEGFTVTRGVAGMPTAFVAEAVIGTGKPVIGFLAEYDALPMLSQKAGAARHDPLVPGAPGHGCGHNAMGSMQALAICAAKEVLEKNGMSATLRYFGTPAEELLAGKAFMAREGLFDGLDAVLDCHANSFFKVSHGVENNALFSFVVTFHGTTAHAGSRPWDGRSAADAVELMHAGTERLREHMLPEQRIHWVTMNEASAPNVVPDISRTWYYVRSKDDFIQPLYERILDCAKGAALMTGTTHDVRMLAACHQRYSNKALAEAVFANVQRVGVPAYSEEEHAFARSIQKSMGAPETGMTVAVDLVDAAQAPFRGDSSDVGDVTLNAPTTTLNFPTWVPGALGHHWSVTACQKNSITHKGIDAAALIQALSACDLAGKPELVAAIAEEFRELRNERPYVNFLAPGTEPPLDWHAADMARFR
ncbi:amidohydrolase [Desulfovibrio sp. OttesenSCG-928-I05]|nr:amidohydrolase [Desulfovibrio sp. OttesenSCG-928-I05]